MPFSHLINYLFQRYVTRGVVLSDQYLKDRLEHTRRHLAGFTLAGGGDTGKLSGIRNRLVSGGAGFALYQWGECNSYR